MAEAAMAARLARIEEELRQLRDVEAIRALKVRYCRYCDGGWPAHGGSHMGPVADLFVEDGIWDGGAGMPAAHGREAIRQLFVELRTMPFILHNALNPLIEISSDTARGSWNLLGCGTLPDGASSWFLGTYDEEYVRTPEGWRYQSLRYVPVRQAPRAEGWGMEPGAAPLMGDLYR